MLENTLQHPRNTEHSQDIRVSLVAYSHHTKANKRQEKYMAHMSKSSLDQIRVD